MPTFCRHGRMLASCPICSKSEESAKPARSPRAVRTRTSAPRAKAATGMRVRRVERAPDDGYDNELASGIRSSVDAARLADELAFSVARLDELATAPPGLYAEVAAAGDPEEAIWLALLVACLGPLRGPDAFAGIEAARVPWATGEAPRLEDVPTGPRAAPNAAEAVPATVAAYRAWAVRAGGQLPGLLGEPGWEPERRFSRAFERLALPGLPRGPRFELLVSLGGLGVLPLAPGALALGADQRDPVVSAAKRVLGIGDAINLERRATELAAGAGVPLAALDLALFNWAAPAEDDRATMGARVEADPARRAAIAAALGV